MWLYGYWFWDWDADYQKVASIDTAQRILTIAPPYTGYGFRSGQRYYAVGVLAEIDSPGEWCGVLMYGNILFRCSDGGFGGIQTHGGKDNVADNNLFVDCRFAISFSPWGDGGWHSRVKLPDLLKKNHKDVDIRRPPYSTKYPELAHLLDNPYRNFIWRNLAVQCGTFTTRERGANQLVDNYVTSEDPGFADLAAGDFRLTDNAAVYDRLGVSPIPVTEIGLYDGNHRATWPLETRIDEALRAPRLGASLDSSRSDRFWPLGKS